MSDKSLLIILLSFVVGWIAGIPLYFLLIRPLLFHRLIDAIDGGIFEQVGEKAKTFIDKLRARFVSRSLKELEVEMVAASPDFIEYCEFILGKLAFDYVRQFPCQQVQLLKNFKNLVGCDGLIPASEIKQSFVDSVCNIAQVIRNDLSDGKVMRPEFGNCPDYVLMSLDPFWEEIVEKALFHCSFISDRAKSLANEKCECGSGNGRSSGDDCGADGAIHGSSSLPRARTVLGSSILNPSEGSFNAKAGTV